MTRIELFCKTKPNSRHWYAYDVMADGELVVSDSRDPETDLARALLARGIEGVVTMLDGRTGKPRTMINIAKAAKLYVSEEDRDGLRYRKYSRHPDIELAVGKPARRPGSGPERNVGGEKSGYPGSRETLTSPQQNSRSASAVHGPLPDKAA